MPPLHGHLQPTREHVRLPAAITQCLHPTRRMDQMAIVDHASSENTYDARRKLVPKPSRGRDSFMLSKDKGLQPFPTPFAKSHVSKMTHDAEGPMQELSLPPIMQGAPAQKLVTTPAPPLPPATQSIAASVHHTQFSA